ncbi:hypothetical protein [Mitsuokella sp. oral taxon 131]|uniref:hypothetical protein n=1 Tax=Mitsuokella sp. oral taxon 131 TaxID=1321780 RepID=UPI00058C99F8|nr:hypothetical protein [Mitsuokella sp. oral taxon 131]
MKKVLLILGVLIAIAVPTYAAQSDAYCQPNDSGYCDSSASCYTSSGSDYGYCGPRRGCGSYCAR